MPFWYEVPLPKSVDGPVHLVKRLVDEHAELHAGTTIAIVETPSGRFAIHANGEAFLRKKLFAPGATIPADAVIATVNADGEKIPYDRPYSLAERIGP